MVEYEFIPAEKIQGSADYDYEIPNYVDDFENAYISWTLIPGQILPPEYEDQKEDYANDIKSQLL